MRVFSTIAEFRAEGPKGSAFFPTMGALHAGHMEVIRQAASTGLPAVVSIFVNPTQFGPNEDFERYPRSFEADCEKAEGAGAAAIFHPSVGEMYPDSPCLIHVPEVTARYEGELRPGHFDGVSTVVCKLFQIVQPDVAFFALKDLQQCAVVERMVAGLNVPVKLRFAPTVRDSDGLAMSSRNAYLSTEERQTAPILYATLGCSKEGLLAGDPVPTVLAKAKNDLREAGFELDYYDLIDRSTFAPIDHLAQNAALITAARLGNTRLIDNVLLF